ncbi:ABC transporter substrate-binding protein [Bradyrhizobium sp. NP1]|uniref:ABC transporter substrate-binding protein n=1 Tax=Bradyrhizobium sp. NP1 TaxID=3049772 RepID=UPI0025A5A913|nr:ABC transporter substrate-binding protein [Bradyrhizobium sp. NP1]WJR76844.1 ABC transporter substrate-binding protein [Bradyrhizobium sp. NP1]
MDLTKREFLSVTAMSAAAAVLGPRYAAAEDAVRIGFFGPLTEAFAGLGKEAKKGADFAVKQANAAGGIGGRKIELVAYDDRGNRTEAVAVSRKMIEQDKVVAIVDGSLSLTSIAAAQVINDARVPMIVAYSNAVNVVRGNEYVFRWASVADVQGWVMGHHAIQERGYKRFAILMQDEEYGRGIVNGAEQALKKLGGEVLFKKAFAPSEREFRAMLTQIKSQEVDAVLMSGFGPQLTAVGRQGTEMGVFPKAQFYVGCDLNEIDWFNGIGENGDGTIGTLEFIAPTEHPFTKQFMTDFQKEYGDQVIQHEAGLAYDATRLMIDAIKRGGVDREGIRKALGETKAFMNLSGVEVSFSELREPFLPLALGQWDRASKQIKLLKFVKDPALIDPRPWYQYYK